jgi:GntR family transcriptional regulator
MVCGVSPLSDPRSAHSRRRADMARQVCDVVRREVLHGLSHGARLPTETELASEFGVSRNAVREALDLLRQEGLVERVQGSGTLVRAAKFDHSIDDLLGLAETLTGHGEVHNEVRISGLVPAPAAVARRLAIRAAEPVVYLERRRLADGVALSLDLTYVVGDLGERLLDEDLVGSDVFVLLERLSGQPLGTADLAFEAVAADAHSAATLDVPTGAPLLMLERLTHLADGRPVDLEFIRMRGDRMTMRGTLRRPPSWPTRP